MKRKLISVIFIFSIAFNLAILIVWGASAIPGKQVIDEGVETGCLNNCAPRELIGFTAEEREAIAPLIEEFNRKRCEICRCMAGPNHELINEIAAVKPDPDKLRKLQDQILEMQREMQSLIVEQMLKEKQLLSLEQQEKYFEYFRQSCGSLGMNGAGPGVCNP